MYQWKDAWTALYKRLWNINMNISIIMVITCFQVRYKGVTLTVE